MALYTFAAGTVLAVKDGEVYRDLCTMQALTGPSESKEVVDVTGTCDTTKQFAVNPVLNPGEMQIDLNVVFDDAGQLRLREIFESNLPGEFRISLPSPSTKTMLFEALVLDLPFSVNKGGLFTTSVKCQITGEITRNF
jgi:hypothetical protein